MPSFEMSFSSLKCASSSSLPCLIFALTTSSTHSPNLLNVDTVFGLVFNHQFRYFCVAPLDSRLKTTQKVSYYSRFSTIFYDKYLNILERLS